jgi:hypothetical protein
MSFLVIRLDQRFNILEALELSTHGLATQKAHEFIDEGFCARVVDKPLNPVAWFQELKDHPPVRPGPKPLMLEAQGHIAAPPDALSMGLPTPLPLTSKVRIKHGNNPGDLVRMSKPVTYQEFRGERRVTIKHGIFG